VALELNFEIPGQISQTVALNQPTMMIGTLASNHVVLRALSVDPIHAIIETDEHGNSTITDLGSLVGVKINGMAIEVESPFKAGDTIQIGAVSLLVKTQRDEPTVIRSPAAIPTRKTPGTDFSTRNVTHREDDDDDAQEKRVDKPLLFSPRDAKPTGDVLECVAYWGDTILEVDHFKKGDPGFENITIGDPTKAHFISAGKDNLTSYEFATISESGYRLNLIDGMEARLRKGGKVEQAGAGQHKLGRRDIAHVKYGAVRYFLLFVRPPELKLPQSGPKDAFFLTLMSLALFFYFIFIPVLWLTQPLDKEIDKDNIWTLVQIPETKKPEVKPPPEPKKPEVKIAQVKEPPPPVKVPPPPEPKPVKPVKPIEKEKVDQPKPVEKPVEKLDPVKTLPTPVTKPTPPTPTPPAPKPPSPSPDKPTGLASTGAKNPNMILAGKTVPNKKLGPSGGEKGSGMNQVGAQRKGVSSTDVKGVEGVDNNKASGVNLGQLGLGIGKVMNKTGPGAIQTNFKNSAGGAGGGSGSGTKDLGLGGLGSGRSLGIAGTGAEVSNFGSGSGGGLSGLGGSGGTGLGDAFGGGKDGKGRGQVEVSIPMGDPAVSGGLTTQEVKAVITTHLNEIRHCYEQLLQRSPNAGGKINSRFVIATTGRVTSAGIESATIQDARMQGCVTGAIQRWKFPLPRGGAPVTITYPFVFNPL
jgi:outer membrane biosynthesis protein TonB